MKLENKTVLFSGMPGEPQSKGGRRPGRPTRQQIEARNQELLEQALDMFLKRGFEGTTVEAIIEAVGMSRRTFQNRYGDKITLFKAALERAIGDYVEPPERLRAVESENLEETLIAVAKLMVAKIRSPNGLRLARIANAEIFRLPEIATYLWERTAAVSLDYLTDLFLRRLWPTPHNPQTAKDVALAFLILVVEGSFQTLEWDSVSDEEFDRQLSYRTKLFLDGLEAS
jgi:AcrR family transcriptional regulator